MAQSAKRFAALLQEGITAVANRTAKPKGVIRDELGYAIGRKGGSAIEYWCYGDGRIPGQPAEVAALARALVDAGQLDDAWLTAFLESAGYRNGAALRAELFPAATDQRSDNLPLPPTPFVGRAQELADLVTLLANADCRLITLVGPGGSGKTRLAVEAARNARSTFPDDALFVALAPLLSADLVVPTVTAALHLSLEARATPQTQLLHYLRRKALLLVLDNFEHLLSPLSHSPLPSPLSSPVATDGAHPENPALRLLTDILQQAPAVTLVVTSRERLNLQGEWVYDVGGLETPESDNATSADEYSAVTLFLQTARRVQTGFAPTAADQAAIVRICRLVTGLPLALELAAAWVHVLSCAEIAEEIAASLNFLTTTLRNLPERHRSLCAVFDHSWRLLNAEEQQVFARCSVFCGGFTREAAEAVASAALPVLAALVDKSLLNRNGEGRYAIHELARQYGAERLADTGEVTQTRNRHLIYFMALAEEAEPHLRSGPQIVQWYNRIEEEHDNLRTALEWAFTDGEFEAGLRMVGALWEFWMNRGHAHEGYQQAERFLARPEAAAPNHLRAKALHTAGALAYYQGRFLAAKPWFVEGIAVSRSLGPGGKYHLALSLSVQGYCSMGLNDFEAMEIVAREILGLGYELHDAWIQGHAFNQLGIVELHQGNYTNAGEYFLESFGCFQKDGQSIMRGSALRLVGVTMIEVGDYVKAQKYLYQSLAVFEQLEDKGRCSRTLRQLSMLTLAQGHFAEAEDLLTQALKLGRQVANTRDYVLTLDAIGRLAQKQGNYKRAYNLLSESIVLGTELEHQDSVAYSLEAFASLAVTQGQPDKATTLLSAAVAFLPAIEARKLGLNMMYGLTTEDNHDYLVARCRESLDETAFAATWAKGAAMTLDQAVAYALETTPTLVAPNGP